MIGEAIAAGCADRAVLARIGGPIGDAARLAASALAATTADARSATRARHAALARAPLPAGFRGVHASWIEAALAGLPARAREALAAHRGDPVDVWLARWACAAFPPMPAIASTRPDSLAAVTALPAADLAAWLARVGADQLALVAIQAAAVDSLAARVGELREAARRVVELPRAGALGPARAAIERCVGVAIDRAGLVQIGARAIAPHVALGALAGLQLSHRLPMAVGTIVGRELAAYAGAPLAHAPTWDALGAPP